MDEKKNNSVIDAQNSLWDLGETKIGTVMVLGNLYDQAFQHGRESILKAAEELVLGAATLDAPRAIEAARAKQAADSVRILQEWTQIQPSCYMYSVGMESDHRGYHVPDKGKECSVSLHRASGNMTFFYGSTQLEAMANAAQSVVAEVEEARNGK